MATPVLAFTVSDVETAATSLTVSGSSSNLTLVPIGNLAFGGSGANRTVSVTPASGQTGTAVITVTVSDGTASSAASFTVMVSTMSPPGISSAASATTTVGTAFSYTITASNSPTSFNATGLPSGLTVDTASGIISGTPSVAGAYTVTLSATNAGGTGNQSLTLNVLHSTIPVKDGFETPVLGSGVFAYSPGGSGWTFTGGAGISGNHSGFTHANPNAPEGVQVAFLQGAGAAEKTVALTAGSYQVTWKAAQRSGNTQNARLLVNGAEVASFQPGGSAWQAFTSRTITVAGGSHVLRFEGLNAAGGDNTALLDAVQVIRTAIAGGSFEAPVLGLGAFAYAPAGANWTFGNGGGISGNASPFTNGTPGAPEGAQVAFLQGWGHCQQTDVWTAGAYRIAWKAAQRVITLSAGSHTIRFEGLNASGGDNTLFIDEVVASTAAFSEGGFELPVQGTGGFAYAPAGSAWTFANGGGISGNSSGFTNGTPSAPEGAQVAFLQGWATCQQTADIGAGQYQITWKAAQRGGNAQNARLLIDGVAQTTFQPASTAWQTFSSSVITLAAGSHTVRFEGVNSAGGDNTLFLDDVKLVEVAFREGGFEAPVVGSGAFAYGPAGSAWTFANGGGISGNASGFTHATPNAPEGVQVAFLQGAGSVQQSSMWSAGFYQITWKAAQRGGNSQNARLLVDGVAVLSFQPGSTAWQTFTTSTLSLGAGSHTLRFEGVNSVGGDNTLFLDAVSIEKILMAPIGPG